MNNKNMYDFVAKIALEYRLSLSNVCKLLGKEPTDKNKMEVYEIITSPISADDVRIAYDYLFNYETVNEDENSSALALSQALIFLKRYTKAQKSGNVEEVKLILKELTRTETAYAKVRNKKDFSKMTEEEIVAVARYRVKYCVSKLRMTNILDVGKGFITRNEEKITDRRLQGKLQLLNNFYEDLYIKNNKSK